MMFTIVIDGGHGGHDPGGTGLGLREKDLVLDRVRRIKKLIEGNYENVKVILTRDSDTFIKLSERANIANKAEADLFISDHKNAFNGTARGFETFIWNGNVGNRTISLHDIMHSSIYNKIKGFGIPSRRKDRANFSVLRNTYMPAILLEEGFIDNEIDNDLMRKEAFVQKYCEGVAEGAAEFLGLKPVPKPKPKPVSKPKPKPKQKEVTGKIADIQRTLNARYDFNIAVDNIFGNQTQSALVKALQTELNKQTNANLVVDGKFGPNTRRSAINVKEKAQGNITWILQAILDARGFSLVADGKFGPLTAGAVKSFQSKNHLVVDGIAGPQTFQMLFK